MGDKIRTVQNLEVVKSDIENNLIFIKGAVPGSKNTFVLIKKAKKKISRATMFEKNEKIVKGTNKKENIKKKADAPELRWQQLSGQKYTFNSTFINYCR